jgi:hypothetical protein
MTDAQIEAGTLTASEDTRTVTGLLLPYGEVGRTNLGRFSIDAGAIRIPRDASVVTANLDHLQHQPVGRAVSLTETDAGIVATFKIADTEEGDALLAEIADTERKDARRKLSVEVSGIVLRAGKAIAGSLFGAAFVTAGAFPSAALMAADVGDVAETTVPALEGSTVSVDDDTVTVLDAEGNTLATYPIQPAEEEPSTEDVPAEASLTAGIDTASAERRLNDFIDRHSTNPTTSKETAVSTTPANTLVASNAPATTTPRQPNLAEMSNLLYAARQGTLSEEGRKTLEANNGDRLFAALSDVKYDGTGGLAPNLSIYPQWIGEVWSAVTYRQQVVPLFEHKDLTSLSINGFRWTTKPTGGTWNGNKSDVPSNTLAVSAVTGTAQRYAVGHDIAREFVDFNVPGFFESYAAAVSEDYARWVDTITTTAVIAGSTALAADALTTLPGATGGTIGSAASAIIDGAAALVTQGTLPTFALVAPALWKQMAKQPQSNVTGYLNTALGLSEGTLDGFVIRPSAAVATGKVLVGAKQAVTVYELPGVPIRVDALDLARGGVDKAAFGYAGVVINDSSALRLVTAATS